MPSSSVSAISEGLKKSKAVESPSWIAARIKYRHSACCWLVDQFAGIRWRWLDRRGLDQFEQPGGHARELLDVLCSRLEVGGQVVDALRNGVELLGFGWFLLGEYNAGEHDDPHSLAPIVIRE